MSMSKKDFIALADHLRTIPMFQAKESGFKGAQTQTVINREVLISELADFCSSQNPRFTRGHWLGYITGENGSNRGNVKKLYRYSDGNTHTDDLTLAQAKRFQRLQNGGTIEVQS